MVAPLVERQVLLSESHFVDISMFVFCIEDSSCIRVNNVRAKDLVLMVHVKRGKKGGIEGMGKKVLRIAKRNVAFHPFDLISIVIKLEAALIEEVGTEDDIVSHGIGRNDESRVIINHHVSIEFGESNF